MDLRSEGLYWPRTCRRPGFGRGTAKGLEVDALVVGSGITGALVAHELCTRGARVAIVDRRRVCDGSTPASTALLQYEIDVPLVRLMRRLGRARAQEAYLASMHALESLEERVRTLGIDVGLRARESVQLACSMKDVREFAREASARIRIGLDARLVTRAELKRMAGMSRPGAIWNARAFEVNPLKLTYGLLKAAQEMGAMILPRRWVELPDCTGRERYVEVGVRGAGWVRARAVVIATGYETPEEFREVCERTELRATYAMVTRQQTRALWPQRRLIWESGDPYFYARTTEDDRIMAGGEDEPFTTAEARDRLIREKTMRVARKLKKLWPRCRATPEFRWAGTFAQTKDGLPYIGRLEKWPRVWFALGYGGNGITFSALAAEIIADDIGGGRSRYAGLFGFGR